MQHWVVHEWTQTASNLTKQGEQRNLTTSEKEHDAEAVEEIPDMEDDLEKDDAKPNLDGAMPFRNEDP